MIQTPRFFVAFLLIESVPSDHATDDEDDSDTGSSTTSDESKWGQSGIRYDTTEPLRCASATTEHRTSVFEQRPAGISLGIQRPKE